MSDDFFTRIYSGELEEVNLMPGLYTEFGLDYIKKNTMPSVLRRHHPQLGPSLSGVQNAFHPWKKTTAPSE